MDKKQGLFLFIMYWFGVHSSVFRQSYTLHSGPPRYFPYPKRHHTELSKYYWLYFLFFAYFPMAILLTTHLCFLVPSPLSPRAPLPLPSGNHLFFSVSMSLSILFKTRAFQLMTTHHLSITPCIRSRQGKRSQHLDSQALAPIAAQVWFFVLFFLLGIMPVSWRKSN